MERTNKVADLLREAFEGGPAARRYVVRMLGSVFAYGLVFSAVRRLDVAGASRELRAGLAVTLAGCTMGAMWAVARYLVEEDDEYLRVRQTQAVLSATGLTLATYTLWGYLAEFRLTGPLPAYDIFPVFSACWLVAVVTRRLLGR